MRKANQVSLIISMLFIGIGCSKKIANYKVTRNGYVIWRYTKPGEMQKDILSNGDTICSGANYMFQIHRLSGDTTHFIKP